ncbi:ABC transporter permease [Poriferisphaera sp. WC338]|uniref:ABC transporter permease n=1 Tax=Poriferisphaera sp. WC338 TaxID=3425129 RepID=UPI003D81989D
MSDTAAVTASTIRASSDSPAFWKPRFSSGYIGAFLLLLIAVPCFVTLPWSMQYFDEPVRGSVIVRPPSVAEPFGSDRLERSLLWRCLLGGAISLGIGISAAFISGFIGVTWGAISGYLGGRTDAIMMRIVDVMLSLPYVLLVVLLNLALKPIVLVALSYFVPGNVAEFATGVVTLLIAIGGVSWLTMARVIRGQVLSIRNRPFIEAARAIGVSPLRTLRVHIFPNLIGVIVVYMTLAVPIAILQESFLSFLGIGVQAPLPSWGNLASDGVKELALPLKQMNWWLLFFPCLLLGVTLMALNFLGDALRDRFDPKSDIKS